LNKPAEGENVMSRFLVTLSEHYKHLRRSVPAQGMIAIVVLATIMPIAVSRHLAGAQELPASQRVEIMASDDVLLVGELFIPADDVNETRPAVILMHMLGGTRHIWKSQLIAPLLEAGYAALTVDLRGHNDTGGERNDWPMMEDDIYVWLSWLREQPEIDPDRISLVGGSLGANLALRVMAKDERVVTAVSLSPYVEARGMTTDDAMKEIGDRPVYLIAGQEDSEPAESVRALLALAAGDVQVRLYPHGAHGTALFVLDSQLAPSIITWLDAHN
jgi:pimeloyl-ACP methyl ester carboxylesterase